MSSSSQPGRASALNATLNIEDLIKAANAGVLSAPSQAGRRSRKRAPRKTVSSAALIAPLLAAEGCKTLSKEDLPLDSSQGSGKPTRNSGGDTSFTDTGGGLVTPEPVYSATPDEFMTNPDEPLMLTADQLLANDNPNGTGPLELVRVFGAVNGTVELHDGMIHFTPNPGYEGLASFIYEVRNSDGVLRTAAVEVTVGDHVHEDCNCDTTGDTGGTGAHDHGGTDEGSHAHPDDAMKAAEHSALMNLVPVDEATHVAVKNGSWFDPATWANGEVPGEGAKVVIPEGIMVDYDGESDVSLFTVRVDGMLHFATDQNTFMEVDTLVVTRSGHLSIGTLDHPVEAGVSAVIQIADNGPIDVAWDPFLLSRGVISHGAIDIHGAEKEAFLKVAVDPMAGDTSLTLESPPEGWQVGDRLVLTGTHLQEVTWVPAGESRDLDTEDEELVITRIEGNTIYFDHPLQYDHDAPRDDLHAYVANYTRNVRIYTENADELPVYQRGHVMFMHSDNIDVRYGEFTDLGRTDKSVRAFDVTDLDTVSYDSNVKGRYALHIHRAGFGDLDDPAMLVGNAVWGSPGWGIVHHDSNAILADNAAYDVFGAAFVAETGNEIGRWVHNIAIKSIGVAGIGHMNEPKVGDDVIAFDNGRTGAGFWFQGRMVDAVDNVAAGIPSGQGFVYMSRGSNEDLIKVLPEHSQYPEALNYLDDAFIYQPAIGQFIGNEALATGVGFMVIKPGPEQGHDVRSIIEDFTAWEVRYGMHLQYTGHYTLKDIDIIGAGNGEWGITTGKNVFDLVVYDAKIEGFDIGIHLEKTTTITDFNGNYQYTFIDVDVTDARVDIYNTDAFDRFLTAGDLMDGLKFESSLGDYPLFEGTNGLWWMDLPGIKTDSLGEHDIYSVDTHRYRYESLRGAIEQEGYWSLPDGRIVTAFERYFSDRATGEVIKISTFVEVPDGMTWIERNVRTEPVYHGILDEDSAAPVAGDDAVTVSAGNSVIIDVLANDFDPDGDPIDLDGFMAARHGAVYANDDGTITYTPDPNYTGADEFFYWVEDDNGNFTKGAVNITVEV